MEISLNSKEKSSRYFSQTVFTLVEDLFIKFLIFLIFLLGSTFADYELNIFLQGFIFKN